MRKIKSQTSKNAPRSPKIGVFLIKTPSLFKFLAKTYYINLLGHETINSISFLQENSKLLVILIEKVDFYVKNEAKPLQSYSKT